MTGLSVKDPFCFFFFFFFFFFFYIVSNFNILKVMTLFRGGRKNAAKQIRNAGRKKYRVDSRDWKEARCV